MNVVNIHQHYRRKPSGNICKSHLECEKKLESQAANWLCSKLCWLPLAHAYWITVYVHKIAKKDELRFYEVWNSSQFQRRFFSVCPTRCLSLLESKCWASAVWISWKMRIKTNFANADNCNKWCSDRWYRINLLLCLNYLILVAWAGEL